MINRTLLLPNIFYFFFQGGFDPQPLKLCEQTEKYARLLGEQIAKKWVSNWNKKTYDNKKNEKPPKPPKE